MTIDETKQVIDKIKIYRPTFCTQFDKSEFDKLKLEWFRIFEPYDYIDVDRKLDEYFEDNENFGRYPDPYYLTKYLVKIESKMKPGIMYISCHICNKKIEMCNFDKHFDRCSSIDYVCRNYTKYFNKTIDKSALCKLSNIEFGQRYWEFCELLVDKPGLSNLEKRALTNAILTHYGKEPLYEIEEMARKIGEEND